MSDDLIQNQAPKNPKRNKKIGLLLLLGPITGLVVVFLIYSVLIFFIESDRNFEMTGNIISVLLSVIGVLLVLLLIIGFPLGILFLFKKDPIAGNFDPTSGLGKNSQVPEEIKKWNWGAAGLTWIWGAWHDVWISLLALIPLVNIFMVFWLGLKGSEMAWRLQKWESVEKFQAVQNKWKPFGIIFFILFLLSTLNLLEGLSGFWQFIINDF